MTLNKCNKLEYATGEASQDQTAGKVMYVAFLLWVISKKPIHGYELINILKKEMGFTRIGPGHIYPMLSVLSEQGLIKIEEPEGGRKKKRYRIMPLGKKHLKVIRKKFFGVGLRNEFLTEMLYEKHRK